MKDLLAKYLNKLGLSDYRELSQVERATYEEWERVLSKEVRIDDVSKFIKGQVDMLQKELMQAVKEGEDRDALQITAKIENYEAIVSFIDEPEQRRKALFQEIESLSNLM